MAVLQTFPSFSPPFAGWLQACDQTSLGQLLQDVPKVSRGTASCIILRPAGDYRELGSPSCQRQRRSWRDHCQFCFQVFNVLDRDGQRTRIMLTSSCVELVYQPFFFSFLFFPFPSWCMCNSVIITLALYGDSCHWWGTISSHSQELFFVTHTYIIQW